MFRPHFAPGSSLDRLMISIHNHRALLVLLAIYLVVTVTYGLLNPLGESPDETAHVDLIRFIGEEGHLPRHPVERRAAGYKSDWPMLYHMLIGAATSWIDYDVLPRLKGSYTSPRHLLIFDGLSPFALIHTDDETFPYQGVVLAWHLARLASTLLSAGTLVVIYAIVLTIRPGDRWLALGVTAATAAIPQFHFIASVVNDDNLLGLLSALFTLTLVKAWQRPGRRRTYAWLGLWLGLAVTTKYSVIPLPLLVVVMLACAVRRGKLGRRAAISRLLLFSAAMTVTAAWWFIYLERYFGKIKERGVATGLINLFGADHITQRLIPLVTNDTISPLTPSQSGATVWDWASTLFRTFWFVQTQANAMAVTAISLVFLGLCSLIIVGLWRVWRRRDDLPWPILGLLALQIGLLLPLPLLRFYLTLSPAEAGQGRHVLFPAAAAVGLLLTIGVSAWFPPTHRRYAGPALAGTLLTISLVSFVGFVLPAFPPRLPVRTSTDAAEKVPNPTNVPFGDAIELIGYEVGEINKYGALPVTLAWHSLDYVNRDFLVGLSLLDENGRVHSISLSQPVDGRYPTRAWEPGDVVRDTAWLPLTGLKAGNYHLQLRLQSSDESDLSPTDATGFHLTDVALPPVTSPLVTPDSLLLTPHSFIVWQAGQPAANIPVYGYRAAIPITLLKSPIPNLQSQISDLKLVGPGGLEKTPYAQVGDTHIFLIDAFWRSGEYSLRVRGDGDTIESDPILRVEVRPRNFDVPPMSTEVRANFGDEIMLLGYDFPERRAKPGDALPITLYWQAQRPPTRHYIVSNHLLNSADLRQRGGRDRVPQDYYSTLLWEPGEVVRDDYWLPVDPSAPAGVYRLDIGLYVALAGQTWHLPLVSGGAVLDANSVNIAPIKVGGPPRGAIVENPSPQHPRADNMGGLVTLLGYDMSLEPETLSLTLYWRCDARLPADFTTFVHVRDATGEATGQPGTIVAQMDRPPADGAYPTSLWDPGEIIRDSIQVPLPSETPSGEYEVVVGLYDFTTGERLPVADSTDNSIMLAEITR